MEDSSVLVEQKLMRMSVNICVKKFLFLFFYGMCNPGLCLSETIAK